MRINLRGRNSLVRRLLVFMLAVAYSSQSAPARQDNHAHHEAAGSIPLEILGRAVPLRDGVGVVRDPVTTTSKEAQSFYNQGLACLHSYSWIDAARSFSMALGHDPKLALAYVGFSYACTGLGATAPARDALERAVALAPAVSERERRRINIRAKQLEAMADPANPSKHSEYKKAIDEALLANSDDPELWLLRGNAEEPTPAGRGQRGAGPAIEFYKKALAISPNHLGAHHYLCHSYENINNVEDALRHGEAHARLAPAIPHAHHMYGHNLRRVGRIDEAIREFRAAYELEVAYYKSENLPARYDWHHQHNLDLLSTSYQYVGQMKTAEQYMRQSFAITSSQEAQEFNKREWPGFLLARGRAKEALQAASELTGNQSDVVRAIGHIMASHALMAMSKMTEAASEAKAALGELRGSASRAAFVAPYLEALQGEFFLRTGQTERGRAMLKQVQRKIRAEPGPDAWTQALFRLEAIARTAREVGDWELAEQTAREMLEHDAAYAGTHYALALAFERKGERDQAIKAFALAEKYWQTADKDLPELAQVRAKLASLRK